MSKKWIRRFNLCHRIRVCRRWKKFFQKPLAGGMGWATFLPPLRTGAPFFLSKDELRRIRESYRVPDPPIFLFPEITAADTAG
jgi:hypothetical protein